MKPISQSQQPYQILIMDTSVSSGANAKTMLEDKGYQVRFFHSPDEALDDLATRKTDGYALIISNYQTDIPPEDSFLRKARGISPDSKRMLLAESTDIGALETAINEAGIHACLTLPINTDDLINQVNLSCMHYQDNIKQRHLQRLISRQNKQMFQIASSAKKKDDQNLRQLAQKDKMIRILESRIRSAGGSVNKQKQNLLEKILFSRDALISSGKIGVAFDAIKEQIRKAIELALSKAYISVDPIDYDQAGTLERVDSAQRELANDCLRLMYELVQSDESLGRETETEKTEVILDDHFELALSKNKTQAFIRVKDDHTQTLGIHKVMQFLEKHKIINGVKNKDSILAWLQTAEPDDEPFLVAMGKDPKWPKDAQIRYHFPIDFLHAGKINKDGSINFKDRGDIPYVEPDTFLASKIFPEKGNPGMDVQGHEILVDDPEDLTFSAGPGTYLSEDGARIYAQVSGQPHLDAMGNVSVCPEYQVKGDVGFETGDINFDGNVIVNGKVKEGFKIKCASLTAEEIQGAEVDINGDLNVSMGIVDTELVKVKGSVQAKFIHNSKINAFGDLIIQREIVDSTIYLSGACINTGGSIINSEISAKLGIQAGTIGNVSAKPSRLTVGVDEHCRLLVAKVDAKLNKISTAFKELSRTMAALEKEDLELHAVIASHAHVQDRSQLELKDIELKIENLKASGNMAALQKISKTVGQIKAKAEEAEKKINDGFDRQDQIATELGQIKGRISELEDENKQHQDEKKRLIEFSNKNKPLPEVTATQKVESGTRVFSENASLTLHQPTSRCRIREYGGSTQETGGIPIYEIKIDGL